MNRRSADKSSTVTVFCYHNYTYAHFCSICSHLLLSSIYNSLFGPPFPVLIYCLLYFHLFVFDFLWILRKLFHFVTHSLLCSVESPFLWTVLLGSLILMFHFSYFLLFVCVEYLLGSHVFLYPEPLSPLFFTLIFNVIFYSNHILYLSYTCAK